MRILLFFMFCFMINVSQAATLTAGYTPVVAQGGTTPQLQNASIYDTGTNSGAGNVGINSITPGTTLDVQGSIRATGFVEIGLPQTGGKTYACFDGNGKLVSQTAICH